MKNPLTLLQLLLVLMIGCKVDGKPYVGESADDYFLTGESDESYMDDFLKEMFRRERTHSKRGPSVTIDPTQEGAPGWMEKAMKEEMAAIGKNDEGTAQKREGVAIPEQAYSALKASFDKMGTKAKGALNGLTKLRAKWTDLSIADRAVMADALQSASTNLQQVVNARDDPVAAIQGGINMIAQFAALAGPKGQAISETLSFISGFLSLFGSGEGEKSVGEVVRDEIDKALKKYRQQDLESEAAGISSMFDTSKVYVDILAQEGRTLTVAETQSLSINVPLYKGLTFMGKLMYEIRRLITNKAGRSDAKKAVAYIELYTKMAILKDWILMETAALYPEELAVNRKALIAVQEDLRSSQKNTFKFLYESDVTNSILPYFDPETSPVTDSYLRKLLEVPDYDRTWAGTWCMTFGGDKDALTWKTTPSKLTVTSNYYPYATKGRDGCFWKLIPHGKHLYTIQNTYKCPDYDYCGRYLAFDERGWTGKTDTALDVKDLAMLYEILGNDQKRIRVKYSCDSNNKGKWCNQQITEQNDKGATTFGVVNRNVGWIWWLTKKPKY